MVPLSRHDASMDNPLLTEQRQVVSTVRQITEWQPRGGWQASTLPGDPTDYIVHRLEYVRQIVTREPNAIATIGWPEAFCCIGYNVGRLMPFNMSEFCALLLQKHRLYGARPIRLWGPVGVCIRIDSKWSRYANIISLQQQAGMSPLGPMAGETARDTLTDILGYCVLGLRLVNEAHDSAVDKVAEALDAREPVCRCATNRMACPLHNVPHVHYEPEFPTPGGSS